MLRRQFIASGLALAACAGPVASPGPPAMQSRSRFYRPTSAEFTYASYCQLSLDAERARFTRPVSDGGGLENVNPGARVTFFTSAPTITARLEFTALLSDPGTYNDVGSVLVDGQQIATFGSPSPPGVPAICDVPVTLAGNGALKTVDIVMPYGASVDFLGVGLADDARLNWPLPTGPRLRFVAAGDSITQGFYASRASASWASLLASLNGWDCINVGFAGRLCVPDDGAMAASLEPDVMTYLIGYNDFAFQVPLALFRKNYKAFITSVRALCPYLRVFCITPIYSPDTGAIPLDAYRQAIRQTLAELGGSANILIEGVDLVAPLSSRFHDSVHPNDTGCRELASNLSQLMMAHGVQDKFGRH